MKVKVGDTVVLVATNRDGSVNGKTFTVSGVLESVSGPERQGRLHHTSTTRASLLRMKEPEVSEIAIRLKDPAQLDQVYAQLSHALGAVAGKPAGDPARKASRAGRRRGPGSAHLGRPVAVRQHRAHDRPARRCSSRSCWCRSC